MTDIVERLRLSLVEENHKYTELGNEAADALEAKDAEIEQLNAYVVTEKAIHDNVECALQAEIERLTIDRSELAKELRGVTDDNDRLRDCNVGMREALEAAYEYIDHATGALPIISAALSQKEGE